MQYYNKNGTVLDSHEHGLNDFNPLQEKQCLLESMLLKSGKIRLLSHHWERLGLGMQVLNFKGNIDTKDIEQQIIALAQKNGCSALCRIRLKVWEDSNINYVIECINIDKSVIELNTEGWNISIFKDEFKPQDKYSLLKTCERQVYVAAHQYALDNAKDDAFITNISGNIIESTIGNIFWIENNVLHTPPLTEGCISGTMRTYLLHQLKQNDISIMQKPLHAKMLSQIDAIFITNSIRGIKWIRSVDDLEFNFHPLINTCNNFISAL